MDTLKYAKVIVNRGPMEKIARTVPLHEIPILRAIHGKTSVIVGDTIPSEMPVPDAEAEHARLCKAYGVHPKAGVPYAEYVYGQPESSGLAKALEGATETDAKAAAPKKTREALAA